MKILYSCFMSNHYEKLCSSKSHYPIIKTQKITHIQVLCNYLLGITTSVQLSPYKYGVLINKLPCQKISSSCIIVANELKMGLLYNNLHTLYIHM